MKKAAFIATVLLVTSFAQAQVTFEFSNSGGLLTNGSDLDNAAGQATTTVGGVTLTAEAFLDGVSADTDLNGSADGFGVNATGSGDSTSRFDNVLGIESMVFSFDVAGTFDSIDLRYIEESANEGLLIFDGGSTYQLTSVTASGSDVVTINESFTAGQSITLTLSGSAGAGENFALESFTITAVPEPSSFAALLGLGALSMVSTRRRGKKSRPAALA